MKKYRIISRTLCLVQLFHLTVVLCADGEFASTTMSMLASNQSTMTSAEPKSDALYNAGNYNLIDSLHHLWTIPILNSIFLVFPCKSISNINGQLLKVRYENYIYYCLVELQDHQRRFIVCRLTDFFQIERLILKRSFDSTVRFF